MCLLKLLQTELIQQVLCDVYYVPGTVQDTQVIMPFTLYSQEYRQNKSENKSTYKVWYYEISQYAAIDIGDNISKGHLLNVAIIITCTWV